MEFIIIVHTANLYVPALPVCGSIVAVVGQEVVVDLPEHMEGDSPIGGRHIVIGLPQHGIEIIQGDVLLHQFMGQAVTVYQPFQLLQTIGHNVSDLINFSIFNKSYRTILFRINNKNEKELF